ncbi:hypothetical protein Nepgr_023441 [Nepenthes gracilis]|uniref:Hpc2-related domain-containing protein n=1 Tax=Nepenthes gracilis TaxID=150966 RepID=A0AAD3XZ17_NEPGR|nr:hypothetical protein Nepgr_023441 [Nepenthes gracilis]
MLAKKKEGSYLRDVSYPPAFFVFRREGFLYLTLMEEEKGGGGDSSSSSRVTSSFEKIGDRIRFTVELRPGETTIVSWKKLMKDAAKANGPVAIEAEPAADVHHPLDTRLVPGQAATNELKDAPQPNRFSAVIEKIERLYMGKDSSDEEDLDDIPDDDQYDTEDSFIDDVELDEYFEVDKSKTKHDGFFVNRGKLESIEPSQSSGQHPKRRRRKEIAKAPVDSEDCHAPNKHMKVGNKGAGKAAPSVEKNYLSTSQNFVVKGDHNQEVKLQNQFHSSGPHSEKTAAADVTPALVVAPSLRALNNDASSSLAEEKNIDRQKTGIFPAKRYNNKLKDAAEFSDAAHAKHQDKGVHTQFKFQPGKMNNTEGSEILNQQKEKSGTREHLDLSLADGKHSMHTVRKEGSLVRPKSNMLEKAIRELEKMVAESRPPTSEVQDVDSLSQAVKRRLPWEIKQKLAKVARLAQGSHGKVSKELLNRLMSILGHVVQLRTLKRHLKVMMSTNLSAKQEKDDKFQQIKKEVVEMIKIRAPSLMSKAIEQQVGGSDDFQESGSAGKGAHKWQYYMDHSMEDKICDLYDIFVDGLDEDAAPQVRKLYAELAELWPKGVMDNHGIKRAICRAKERKRGQQDRIKEQEKIKRKKLMAMKTEENARVESSLAAQSSYVQERLATDLSGHAATSHSRFVQSATSAATAEMTTTNTATIALCVPSHLQNAPNFDRPKQERAKGMPSSSYNEMRAADGALVKKKVKRKPETDLGTAHFRPEKLASQQSDDRQKSNELTVIPPTAAPQNSNFQTATLPSFEQLT